MRGQTGMMDEEERRNQSQTAKPGCSDFLMALLRFESDLLKGKTVACDRARLRFGRHISCECVLNHPTVSREHFFVEQTGEKFFVVDNDSGNGTFVNDERVTWMELRDGDVVRAGPFRLRFELSTTERDTLILPTPETTGFSAAHERQYPREYLDGIRFFNAEKYFEAHEAWEEIWVRSSGEARLFLQMLIQSAVCFHHYEQGNRRGAEGLYRRVIEKLSRLPAVCMSLDVTQFARQFTAFFTELLKEGDPLGRTETVERPLIELLTDDALEEGVSSAAAEL